MRVVGVVAAVLLWSSGVSGQQATSGVYGPSCHGATLSHAGVPLLGSSTRFQTWYGSTWAGRPVWYVVGQEPSGFFGLLSGGQFCFLGVYPVAIRMGVTDGSGTWIVRHSLPRGLSFMGVRVDEQFWMLGDWWMTSNHGWFRMGL